MLLLGVARVPAAAPLALGNLARDVGSPAGAPLVQIDGVVRSASRGAALASARVTLADATLRSRDRTYAIPGRVELIVPGADLLPRRDSRVRALGTLLRPRAARNPGETDGSRARRRRGVDAVVALKSARALTVVARPAVASWRARLDAVRDRLRTGLETTLGPSGAALAIALVLGDRQLLDPDDLDAAAVTGTIHLLAISGLHVGIVLGVIRGLLGLFVAPTLADLAAVLVTLLYAGLAGAGSPVLRAAVFALVVLGGRCLGRRSNPPSVVGATLSLLLLIDPGELFRPGFQLTFAAVVGIWSGAGRHHARRPATVRARIGRWMADGLATSLRASVATAPLVWFHFGRISLVGPLAGLLVSPVFVALLGLALLCAALVCVAPALVGRLAPALETVAASFLGAVRLTAEVPFAAVSPMRPGPLALAAAAAASALWLARRRRAAAALVLVVISAEAWRARPPDALELWLFDVGHGQAALLRSPSGRTLLVDCGSRGRVAIGRRTVLPAMDAVGARTIDQLVVSHGDSDHLSGVADVARTGRVGRLVVGPRPPHTATGRLAVEIAGQHVGSVEVVRRGDRIVDEGSNGLVVHVLHPPDELASGSQNDASLVLLAEFAGRRVLLPGDLESVGLRALLAAEPELRADVLVLPHHGQPDPWLAPLLHCTRPSLVVASRDDTPVAGEVVGVVDRSGAASRSTANHGAIVVRIRPDGKIRAESQLESAVDS